MRKPYEECSRENLYIDFLIRSPEIDAPIVKNIAIRGAVLIPLSGRRGRRESRLVISVPIGDVFQIAR